MKNKRLAGVNFRGSFHPFRLFFSRQKHIRPLFFSILYSVVQFQPNRRETPRKVSLWVNLFSHGFSSVQTTINFLMLPHLLPLLKINLRHQQERRLRTINKNRNHSNKPIPLGKIPRVAKKKYHHTHVYSTSRSLWYISRARPASHRSIPRL